MPGIKPQVTSDELLNSPSNSSLCMFINQRENLPLDQESLGTLHPFNCPSINIIYSPVEVIKEAYEKEGQFDPAFLLTARHFTSIHNLCGIVKTWHTHNRSVSVPEKERKSIILYTWINLRVSFTKIKVNLCPHQQIELARWFTGVPLRSDSRVRP